MRMRLSVAAILSVLSLAAASSARAAMATATDHDGDGYDDATELAHGYTPFGPGTLAESDADRDGLSDGDELLFGTDPLKSDSDGDGYPDGTEVRSGYDPLAPGPVKLKKRIVITLATQTLAYYAGPKELGAFQVSTGKRGTPTPVGAFASGTRSRAPGPSTPSSGCPGGCRSSARSTASTSCRNGPTA